MSVDHWLQARLGTPRSGESVLVLCRSRATVTRVRRYMAERGGWIGAEVVTPHGLVASLHRDPLGWIPPEPERVLPADNPLASTISDRPGLVAAARRWVRRTRERIAVGLPVQGAPDWLIALAHSDWSSHDQAQALVTALTRLRASPLNPTESHRYDRVVLLGFDAGPEILDPGAVAVTGIFGPCFADPPVPPEPLPSIEVSDAVAEARLGAWLCAERPDDTLVLVSESSTARRLRDSLNRNGLATGFTDPPPAASSALGGLALRVTPWFTELDPPLRVTDVAWVFGHRVLGRNLKPPADRALERDRVAAGLEDPEVVRPGRRTLARMLAEARVLDAPLSRWLGRLRVLTASVDRDPKIRGAALALAIRLRMLQAAIAGEPLEVAFADEGPGWDDFDSLVAELLGDESGPSSEYRPRSLGGLKRFLIELRPRVHDDPAARAVLGALRDRGDVPADPATVREALGSPVDAAQLGAGVDVLTYDDWDGRPAGRLILLDVHHKGLARRPTPDPLLDEDEQTALGVPAGQALVDFRIATVHRAAAAADEVIAIVAQRDAGGRDLVAPIQLQLVPIEGLGAGGSYGLGLDLPERCRACSLEVRHQGDPQPPPTHPLGPLAVQATAEWYRSGRGPLPASAVVRMAGRYEGLDEHLRKLRPIAPEWVLPWLGHAEGVPEAALPERAWSTSRLFDPISACLYRAFVGAVLRVEKPEEIPEDLDPREVGTAIHDALEEVGTGFVLRVDRADLERARAEVVEALRASTRIRLQQARDELAGLSEARQAAVLGRQERWNAHWPSWARSRVRPHETPSPYARTQFIRNHPLTQRGAEAMAASVGGAARYPLDTLRSWLVDTARAVEEGKAVHTWPPGLLAREGERYGGLDASISGGLLAFLETPDFADVVKVCKSAKIRANGLGEPIVATGVELPFGPASAPGKLATADGVREVHLGEVSIQMGRAPVALSGRIDRVVLTRYNQRPLFEIVDYKTGKGQPRSERGVPLELWTARKPQLMVYALALRAAVANNRLEPELPNAAVASVGWDYVRFTESDPTDGARKVEPNKFGRFLVDNVVLDEVAERLGTLIDEGRDGRWTLMPRATECPAVGAWGAYCDAVEACRMRALPPQEAE